MDGRRSRGVSRARSPAISYKHDRPREKIKDCCRKIVAFMCTQVGVGALILCYTMIGALGFMRVERSTENPQLHKVMAMRNRTVRSLFKVAVVNNVFNKYTFDSDANKVLKQYQSDLVQIFRHGYDERPLEEIWTFPAALMFSLSIITMVGYGNMVPKTSAGKILTMVYALFGIPLYVLYFKNMGKIFAGCFKWGYRRLYECSTEKDDSAPPKRIVVPSTACLWVILAYILTGAVMFSEWEQWGFLDSTYFCVTSLCKLGMGDLVPGADVSASTHGNQTKLVINFIYMLLGLGLVAMCYNLMREEIRIKVNETQEDFNQCLEDTKLRLQRSCRKCRSQKAEYDDY
ncbi:TWiK family of potassium channels protein 7 isoform X1 [Cylas formicarius]|uniref:TWiK family of potassium channels protein 7 isoform X1 n=1 Tax=Cylas formicarius TaxID=197179 RepID=UPI00295895AE|nr:TWiK family of potassium channels protein 7 isoform X1 [Cylas formicarius]XP_060527134.1 TWiK family of potassium channels protein 7 isoform X1 [Cylas formicarius]XP_060527136.1 TWiK family of potassium channels protein 7 isoform X1 [Cylas formicarius]